MHNLPPRHVTRNSRPSLHLELVKLNRAVAELARLEANPTPKAPDRPWARPWGSRNNYAPRALTHASRNWPWRD
jgi:hypothetical protein